MAGRQRGGVDGWRVPTLRELSTLIDHRHDPAADPVFNTDGSNDLAGSRWSATEYAPDTSKAWRVDFGNGQMTKENKDANNRRFKVRCVRVP